MRSIFRSNQHLLTKFANSSIGRSFLKLDPLLKEHRVVSLMPSSVIYYTGKHFIGRFYAQPVFEKRLLQPIKAASYVGGLSLLHYYSLTLFLIPLVTDTFTVDGGGGGRIVANTGTWQNTHDLATGAIKDTTGQIKSDNTATPRIVRYFAPFDTSAIGIAAQISLGGSQNFIRFVANGSASVNSSSDTIVIVASTQASNTALAIEDYDAIGTTSFGSLAVASFVSTNGTNNDIILNTTGDNAISKTGFTKLAARMETDRANSAPGGGTDAEVSFTGTSSVLSVSFQNPGAAIFFMM